MSAAVASRNSPHVHSSSRTHSPMDLKRNNIVKSEDKSRKESPLRENPKVDPSPSKQDSSATAEKPSDSQVKQETKPAASDAEATQPLAPPPRPQQNNSENPDYFSSQHKSHLSYEPNPFEQSFGNPSADTPGKSVLPPVASLTSPAPLTGNSNLGRRFDWDSSLRAGPLSPAMLSGPTGGDYFDSIRSFPTPNESSLRTGLTPGGGGSMFPAPSPGSQAFLNSLASGGATPSTIEFQRAAVNAAAATRPDNSFSNPATSQSLDVKAQPAAMDQRPAHQGFGQHDNDAANGLYLLAQAGNESQSNSQFAVPSAPATVNGQDPSAARTTRSNGSIGGSVSATSARDQEEAPSEGEKQPATRKSKRASAGKGGNNRRKAEETPAKQPASKKSKANNTQPQDMPDDDDDDDSDEGMKEGKNGDTRKMTDEEKRKNFLERNRVAALKCRQRKKQWLQNLQNKVEIFSSENDALNSQVAQLRDEILNLKTILIAHKDCPIAQQQAQAGAYLQHGVDYGNAPNPYTMGMQQQQAVSMGGPRRFS